MLRYAAGFLSFLIAFTIASFAQMDSRYQFPGAPPAMNRHDSTNARDMLTNVSGTVVSSDNKPLKDIHVELRDGSGIVVSSTYSNPSGYFEFPQVPSGLYQVVATAGLEQAQERVDVNHMSTTVQLRVPVSSTPTDGNPANSVSVAQYRVPSKARDELRKAMEASFKGKSDEAQKHIAKALEIYPKYADALTERAVLKLTANDQNGAIDDLQEAIKDDGNCSLAYVVMGAALNMQSKFDDAIRSLQRGEALSPNSWQAYFEMGKALVGKAQYEPALRQLEHAQALMPREYPAVHLVKAHAMLALDDYSDAMTELQEYLQKEPNGPNSEQAQKMLAQARAFASTHPGNK
jgi:predicted Zn-dependent protease